MSHSNNTEGENLVDAPSLDRKDHHPELPDTVSRRKFLSQASMVLGGISGVAVVVPVAAFIVGPLFQEAPVIWRPVGDATKFKVGETVQVSFPDASPLPWAGVAAQTAAWLRRVSDTKFVAYSVNCSHLGCPVNWIPSAELFLCPCHGGAYYSDGRVAAGPPPLSLPTYETRINAQSGQVEIKASGVPITTA